MPPRSVSKSPQTGYSLPKPCFRPPKAGRIPRTSQTIASSFSPLGYRSIGSGLHAEPGQKSDTHDPEQYAAGYAGLGGTSRGATTCCAQTASPLEGRRLLAYDSSAEISAARRTEKCLHVKSERA